MAFAIQQQSLCNPASLIVIVETDPAILVRTSGSALRIVRRFQRVATWFANIKKTLLFALLIVAPGFVVMVCADRQSRSSRANLIATVETTPAILVKINGIVPLIAPSLPSAAIPCASVTRTLQTAR